MRFSTVPRGMEARRSDVARVEDQAIQFHRVSGRLLLVGNGEVAVDVTFPVLFAERPGVSFGAELEDGNAAVVGHFPKADVVVLRWLSDEKLPGIFQYRGATLGITVSGVPESMWVHWHMEGKAFRNPIGAMGKTEDVI